jgi:hypothetical protein
MKWTLHWATSGKSYYQSRWAFQTFLIRISTCARPNFGHGYIGISRYEWLRDLETYTIETTVDILETVHCTGPCLSLPPPPMASLWLVQACRIALAAGAFFPFVGNGESRPGPNALSSS